MSAMTTRTWRPRSNARCSATVSARRGVVIRSTSGSSAVLRNRTRSRRRLAGLEPLAHRAPRRRSSGPSPRTRPRRARRPRSPGRRSARRARGAGGRRPRRSGSFWPRTSVASPSTTETPVRIGSPGVARAAGLIGLPPISRRSPPRTGGPPSSGSPRPLQTRPSHSSPTGIRIGLPANETRAPASARPLVPSKTCDHRELPVDVEHDAVPHLARVEPDLDELVPPDVGRRPRP